MFKTLLPEASTREIKFKSRKSSLGKPVVHQDVPRFTKLKSGPYLPMAESESGYVPKSSQKKLKNEEKIEKGNVTPRPESRESTCM